MNTDTGIAPALALLREAAQQGPSALWALLDTSFRGDTHRGLAHLASEVRMPALDMAELHTLKPDFSRIPFPQAVRRMCVVARDAHGNLSGLTVNPFDDRQHSWAEDLTQETVTWHLVSPPDLSALLAMQESRLRALDGALKTVSTGSPRAADAVGDLTLASIAQDASPIIRLVHSTVFDAMRAGASDIHIECVSAGLRMKYRIDGVLSTAAQLDGRDVAEQVVSRIKIMSELDISERRTPQDGRFRLAINGSDVDFRVSVMPSLFGEDVVIRILDKRSLADHVKGLQLERLGFDGPMLGQLRKLTREPYGMFLVTGPTGSGKTTTLYAALTEINSGHDKIITIEDPIEYELPGILQIPVNEKKGLTFARGLRSILRHDPDKILVGEIRDPETAQIAIQSALTGHLVFTSVHANNVFDVLGRFQHMGVDAYSFVSALNGVLAQRLVRVICTQCAQPLDPQEVLIVENAMARDFQGQLFRGVGCGHCRGTGYRGRRAISELLKLDDDLREMIVRKAPIRQLKESARANGTTFLRESAVAAVAAGWTTMEEIDRVTFSN